MSPRQMRHHSSKVWDVTDAADRFLMGLKFVGLYVDFHHRSDKWFHPKPGPSFRSFDLVSSRLTKHLFGRSACCVVALNFFRSTRSSAIHMTSPKCKKIPPWSNIGNGRFFTLKSLSLFQPFLHQQNSISGRTTW